ncbi:MAG: cation:proton antiporter, partial [Alkalibacterium sp.]|nr:cation:proton antiporter [Alkalibacterium sp.]
NILVGILLGAVIAYVFVYIFNKRSKNHSEKLVLLLSLTIIFVKWGDYTGIASLLGVMTIGFLLLEKVPTQAQTFSTALNGLWFFLQILLFALVGSEVDITKALDAGLSGVLIIIIGLLARSLGVWLVTMNSGLDIKERLFCMIAYTPKATVQAAIGAMPLALGVQQGTTILALAVMSIILTAPLGALGIYKSAPHLLNKMK